MRPDHGTCKLESPPDRGPTRAVPSQPSYSLPTALARADAGRQTDELLDEIAEIQREIAFSPAVTLQDAAVKLRRLSVYLEGPAPARLLEGALEAVERTAALEPGLAAAGAGDLAQDQVRPPGD